MSKRLSITARRHSHLGFEQCENRRLLAGDTVVGDCDGDGVFDSADLVHVMQVGKFESGRLATAADGDWNEDGVFNAADLVHVFQQGHYGRRPAEMTDAIFAAQGRPDGVGQRPDGVRPDGVGQRPDGVDSVQMVLTSRWCWIWTTRGCGWWRRGGSNALGTSCK
ncbi:MAG: hypothetical protein R3C28_08040 [Pirellulaceae bacterium]